MEYGESVRSLWVACGNLGDDALDGIRLASDEERRAAALLVERGENCYTVAQCFFSRNDTTCPRGIHPEIWRFTRRLQAAQVRAALDAAAFGAETERWLAMLTPKDRIRFLVFLVFEQLSPEEAFLSRTCPQPSGDAPRPALHLVKLECSKVTEEAAWNMLADEASALGEEIFARWEGASSLVRGEAVALVLSGENPGDVIREAFDR